MFTDPIVTEVRMAGRRLSEQAGGDLHRFFENLRAAQQQYAGRLTKFPVRPVSDSTTSRTTTTPDD